MSVVATWHDGMEFKIDFPQGESLTLTSLPLEKRPGPGPNPMDAVQGAVVACTGMDVVLILSKMRKTPKSLRIEVDAERQTEHPRVFTRLELVYHFEGPELDPASVRRAVQLSQDKYCSVAAMLRPAVDLAHRIVLNGEVLETD